MRPSWRMLGSCNSLMAPSACKRVENMSDFPSSELLFTCRGVFMCQINAELLWGKLLVCLPVCLFFVVVVIFTEMHLIPSSFTRISGIPGLYWGKMRSASKLCWCCRGLITERSGGGKKVNLDKIKTQKPSPAHHFSRKFSFGEGCWKKWYDFCESISACYDLCIEKCLWELFQLKATVCPCLGCCHLAPEM